MAERALFKHVETGIVASLNVDFAAVFGDRFERVEPEAAVTEEKPKTPRNRKAADVTDDSEKKED